MTEGPPSLNEWNPLALEEVQEVFTGAPFRWWVCGGVALELYAGRSWRSHEDLDIGVLRTDTDLVYRWLADWDLWVATLGELRAWRGEPLEVERDENNVWARDRSSSSWRFDLTLGSGDEAEWVYRRDETIKRAWSTSVLLTADGLPYLAPELQLLFKSKNPRPKDDFDAEEVIPLLDPYQRTFLAHNLGDDHRWRRPNDAPA